MCWRSVTLLELWNCILGVFLSDPADRVHFCTVVREEFLGEQCMRDMSVLGLYLKSELRVNAEVIVASFVLGASLRERIVQFPLNLVVEVQRTGEFSCSRG